MVSVFSYLYSLMSVEMEVTTIEDEKIEINYEQTDKAIRNIEGEIKENYFQRFKLQPNTYIISFKLGILKIGKSI